MKDRDLDIEEFFKDQDFDLAEPAQGHKDRFLEKLEKQKAPEKKKETKIRHLWTPILAVAASLILVVLLTGNLWAPKLTTEHSDLAAVSPEMKETQQFYNQLIRTELEKVNSAKSPETEAVVKDALAQMERLDVEYNKLRKDLTNSGKDKRVIFAMVSNLQQRIDILNNVLSRIEEINELKNPDNENNYL